MSIQNTDTVRRPGELVPGNAVDAELASLRSSREFALERKEKGHDVETLLAYYDRRIFELMKLR